MRATDSIPEQHLQRAVQRVLGNPGNVYATQCGKRLQVLAPGRVNVHEGPDYLDMALLLDARVVVGAGEFHRRSSDWLAHDHDANILYSNVVLHIVLEHDGRGRESGSGRTIPVLVLDSSKVVACLHGSTNGGAEDVAEEIHAYALIRLLRLTAEHTERLSLRTIAEVLPWSVESFLRRYAQKRHRPAADRYYLERVVAHVPYSPHQRFVAAIARGEVHRVHEALRQLVSTSIAGEGEHLRREIILNCVIPCCLAVARDEARIGIFDWYWSLEALYAYGSLTRIFRGSSQRYVWQQQGMLEIARERSKDVRLHETVIPYGGDRSMAREVGRAIDDEVTQGTDGWARVGTEDETDAVSIGNPSDTSAATRPDEPTGPLPMGL